MSITILKAIETIAAQFSKADLYYGHGTDNAWDEACYLVLQVAGLPPDATDAVANQVLFQETWARMQSIAQERIHARKPLAYLVEEAWFAGLPFYVNPNVLVPRSPIAELIEQGFSPWLQKNSPKILEIGTGSGCIAVAIAHYLPKAQITATDICPQALQVARKNIARHHCQTRITLVQSDLFENLTDEKFDLIVSNPPYVDESEMSALPEEYRYEPRLGLASGQDGLDHVRKMVGEAANYLHEDGLLIVEVGASQQAMVEAFPNLVLMWMEFQFGGEGVFLVSKAQLRQAFGAETSV